MKLVLLFLLCVFGFTSFGSTALTVTKMTETAVAIPYESNDTAGNTVLNPNGDVFLLFKNTDLADSATVTITAQKTSINVSGYGVLTKSNITVPLTASQEKMVGPLNALIWNNGSDQIVLSYSGAASAAVEVAAIRAVK